MKIRSRILINTALVASTIGLTFMFLIYSVLKNDLEKRAFKNMTSHLNLSAANLDEHFMSSGNQLQSIAANIALFDKNKDLLSSDLKAFKSLIMEFKSISYTGLDGKILASSENRLIGKNLMNLVPVLNEEFKEVLKNNNGMLTITPIVESPGLYKITGDSLTLQMFVPVYNKSGRETGVLSAFFDVGLIANHINFLAKTMGDRCEVFLLNGGEQALISSNKQLKFQESFADTGINGIKRIIGKNVSGYNILRASDGQKIILGYVKINHKIVNKVPDWILVVKEPYVDIVTPIQKIFSDLLYIFFLLVLLVGSLAVIDSHFFTRPLKLLVLANKLLSEGKYEKIQYSAKNEVGDVVRAFNHAVEKIQNTTKELTENEELFRNLAESTSAGIIIIQDAKIVYANKAGLKIFGYGAEELYKMDFWEVAHPDYREMVRKYGLSRQQGEEVPRQYEFKVLAKNGDERWASLSAGSIKWKGKMAGIGTAIDFTEKKRAEEKLLFDDHRLKQAQRIGKMFFLDWNLKTDMVEISLGGSELLGFDHVKNQFKFEEIARLIHPDDINYVMKNVFDARDDRSKLDVRYRMVPPNQEELYIWSTGELIFDKDGKAIRFLGTMQDVTAQKKAEESLKLFRILIDGASDAIEVINPKNGRFIDVNEKGCVDLGYTREEFLKLTIADIDPTVDPQTTLDMRQDLRENGKLRWEGTHQRKDGSVFPVEVNLKIVEFDREYIVAVVRDITERKKIERELIEAKEKAEESERLKSAFLANMSHEIRTPMNGILGFTQLLKTPKLTIEEKEKYLDIIEKSGERMLSTVNDIIDISKIEAGQMTVSISETNVNEQMEFVYNFFKPEAALKELELRLNMGLPDNESYINTDREKFYGILTNLVKNALKFTRKGYIELGYSRKGEALKFYVRDTGSGISKDQQESVFNRFIQGSTSLTRNYEGSGLGLAITKAYVEMLGGKIWMESEIDDLSDSGKASENNQEKGSTFYFTIPYNILNNAKLNDIDQMKETENFKGKLNILVVEDDEVSGELLSRIIKPYAKNILLSRGGIEAVETCRKNSDIDLVFMDIKMPDLDGYEATKEIRKFNKEVVIIAQTAFALSGDREKSLEAGCNDYLSKPVKIEIIQEMMKKYFA
ncbi:MAG: PAS domain S-box protein [Bacteroidales bacterium]|nr:PAS domain S-box protein [Bacteroidales bacterium]